jgi:NADPH:quinone reductase-like Zn-dependent oxidoreductase
MKAWRIPAGATAGIDTLRKVELPEPPAPAVGQVRVRLHAASVNPRDLQVLGGRYATWVKPELIPLSDGAGEVLEVGPGVWRVAPGDRVALTFHPHWIAGAMEPSPAMLGRGGAVDGALAEQCIVSENELVRLPAHLSYEEGSTLPCAALTAWSALTVHASLMPGHWVLTQGTGGVSLFALQLARLFGARVVALASNADKAQRLRTLGAAAVVDRTQQPDWADAVRAACGGVGVDRVVDVGGAASVSLSVRALRQGGVLAVVGLLGGPPALDFGFFTQGVSVHPIRVGSREQFEQMNRAIEAHGLTPVIDRVYGFDEAREALQCVAAQQQVGKIVVRIGEA